MGSVQCILIPLWKIGTQALREENQTDQLINSHPGLTTCATKGAYEASLTFWGS